MPKTAVYIRCSSYSQSTASQRFEIEDYLSQRVICGQVTWYEDAGVSGKDLDRPSLRRLQQDIVSGVVDTVLLWKLDRLARSITDGIKLLSDWVQRGVRIVVITQDLDLSGPVGRMVAALLLGVSEMEREHLRERQAAGIALAKQRGVKFGRPQTVDVSAVKQLRSEGLGATAIARRLKISRQSVYNVW